MLQRSACNDYERGLPVRCKADAQPVAVLKWCSSNAIKQHKTDALLPATAREYQFDPNVAEVSVKEGEDVSVSFTARRVAWSVTGGVLSVGGQPLADAVIEALVGGELVESGVSDGTGRYKVTSACWCCRLKLFMVRYVVYQSTS